MDGIVVLRTRLKYCVDGISICLRIWDIYNNKRHQEKNRFVILAANLAKRNSCPIGRLGDYYKLSCVRRDDSQLIQAIHPLQEFIY